MHHAYLDKYANQNSFFHRLDSRVKFLAALIYTILILSIPPRSAAVVFCYVVAPFGMLVWAGIPIGFVARRILAVSPFVLVLALSCPFFDQTPYLLRLGDITFQLSGGWMRCFTILAKFAATMLTLFALTCTTRFTDMLAGLQQMQCPSILIVQLSFVYRYLFVLVDRVHHILRARAARKLRYLGLRQEIRIAAIMIAALFIQSLESAERIYRAMQGRGFTGSFHALKPIRINRRDIYFIFVFIGICIFLHSIMRIWLNELNGV
ncbi:MAG TPA: cobalt ECF transporter T component CbiQ [Anaerohalosphaeraceae bacterium]|nr:cobalt ECF transporter T component CbiQ [Anaerohalosphaeraceae bacterium]